MLLYTDFVPRQEGNWLKRIPPMSFYDQLVSRIDRLILDKGTFNFDSEYVLNFDDLSDEDQGELVTFVLEKNNRNIAWLFQDLSDDKNNDLICSLIAILKDKSPDNLEDFANLIRDRAIKHYSPYLDYLIGGRCAYLTNEDMKMRDDE